MAITPTKVLRHIERKMGAKFQQLELDTDEIMETIIEESLVTFSNYYPYIHTQIVIPEKDEVDGRVGVYHLKTNFDILGVSKVLVNGVHISGANPRQFTNNPFDMKIQADLYSAVTNPLTFHWEPPKKLQIYPKYTGIENILVELKVVHPSHFGTIPLSLREEFHKLCLYDVQDSLHKIRRHFENINTTFANIELFMQDLEAASDKREELLDKWRTEHAKSANRKKLYIY